MIADEELIKQIKYGEKTALNLLLQRYHRPIHAYAVRMGFDYHIANDIVQDIFIKLIRNITSYETDRPFRPWLYTIASNTCKDYFKKAHVKRDVLTADTPEAPPAIADNPEDLFMLEEKRNQVAEALFRLSEIHREVIVLRYYQELKLEEIAAVLTIPLGTVKSRLSHALHHLKNWFEEGGQQNDHKAG